METIKSTEKSLFMIGLGTVINTAGIVAGGILGLCFGKLLPVRFQETLNRACGISILFIGISGALEGMLTTVDGAIVSARGLFVVVCLAPGALIGELLNVENGFERFGCWLKLKTGNSRDKRFVDGFVTASLTVCIGAMAIVGALQDGLKGDYSILTTKAVLDLIIILVMTGSMGKGCIFSAIPVALLQGGVTALSQLIRPLMTDAALENLSLIGNILIFCVGVNLVWGKKIRVANLLPAIVIAVIFAFLPIPMP